MRVTPKMSDNPAATRNNDDAPARPFKSWTKRPERVMGYRSIAVGSEYVGLPLPGEREQTEHPHNFDEGAEKKTRYSGRSFFTSAAAGKTLAPSTYLKSTITPLPSTFLVLPTYAPIVDC